MRFFGFLSLIAVPLDKVFRAMKSLSKPKLFRAFYMWYVRLPWAVGYWLFWGTVVALIAYGLHLYFEYRNEELRKQIQEIKF
jgi:Na+-driven multidrug efflux pump